MNRLSETEVVELQPGEIRALAKLSALHPLTAATVREHVDGAGVGWGLVTFRVRTNSSRQPFNTFRYMISTTGRAWTATRDNQRIEPPVFDADYEDAARQ